MFRDMELRTDIGSRRFSKLLERECVCSKSESCAKAGRDGRARIALGLPNLQDGGCSNCSSHTLLARVSLLLA